MRVLGGALPLFQQRRLLNVLVRMKTCCKSSDVATASATEGGDAVQLFKSIASYGYGMRVLSDRENADGSIQQPPAELLVSAESIVDYMQKHAEGARLDVWFSLTTKV